MRTCASLIATALLLIGACRGEGGGDAVAPSPNIARGPAVRATVTSTEDRICKEHGVFEAVCTKCNPALAVVFKAKGDWCDEHELPESICPTCNPEQGGRPAVDVSADAAPIDGMKVTFKTMETARLAGIRVVEASESPNDFAVTVVARTVYDPRRVAQVNARAPGVVRSVAADVGTPVEPGSLLALIESAEVRADQSRHKAARFRVKVANAGYERLSGLHKDGIVAEREVLVARQELEAARAEYDAISAALRVVGADAGGPAQYALAAPIAGVVTKRHVTVGEVVATDRTLFQIVNTAVMWVEVDIPALDLPYVAVGQSVTLTLDGLPGRVFHGTLDYIAPEIDSHTRTVRGRMEIANPEGVIRANMFGQARILPTETRLSVMVPRNAVQRTGDLQIVFVRLAEDVYEARRVDVSPANGVLVAVSGRVGPGDKVVTDGSFLLKTETLKGSIGAGCCAVE